MGNSQVTGIFNEMTKIGDSQFAMLLESNKVANLWDEYDKDHSGYLDQSEMEAFFNHVYQFLENETKKNDDNFRIIDKNEMISCWKSYFDTNKDNLLSKDEWKKAIQLLRFTTEEEKRRFHISKALDPVKVYEGEIQLLFNKHLDQSLENNDTKNLTDFLKQHENFILHSDQICSEIWGKVNSRKNVSEQLLTLLVSHTHIDQYSLIVQQTASSGLIDYLKVLLISTPFSPKEISPQYNKILTIKAFSYAAASEQINTMNILLSTYPDINLNPLEDEELLIYSLANEQSLKSLKFLLQQGEIKNRNLTTEMIEVNQTITPILCSVIQNLELKGNELLEVVDLLLQYKADVNTPITSHIYGGKEYPLGLAVRRGDIDVIKKLIDNHANIIAMNTWKAKLEVCSGTALHIAYKCGQESIAKFLIEKCPELTKISNNKGELPSISKKKK